MDSTANTPAIPLFLRFRTRLVLLILLVFLPALALTVFTNLNQRRTEKARIKEGTVALARLAAANQQNFVKNTEQLLATLSQFAFLVRNTNRLYCQTHFINLRKLAPDYLDFGLIEADGTLFCSAAVTSGTPNLAGRSHFERCVRTQRFSIGDYQTGGLTSQPVLDFGYPIFDDKGRFKRVLYVSLNLARLSEAAAQGRLPSEAALTVFDRSGNVVARYPEPHKWVGQPLAKDASVQRILQQNQDVFEMSGMDGINRLFATTAISDGYEPSLFVSVGIPAEVLFASANRALMRGIIALALLAILALLVGHIYAEHSIVRPMKELVSAAKRLAQGDRTARARIPAEKGELSILGNAFDEMAAALQQRHSEIEAAHAEVSQMNSQLEQRVKDRTFQLEALNRELEAFSYSVSHDLRAPLRHIGGFVQMLREDASSKLSERGRRYVDTISESASNMGKLIDGLLAFARMGRATLSRSWLDMAKRAEEARHEASRGASDRSIDWKIDSLPEVWGDGMMLKQVWVNLLSNAVKFTKERERAEIKIGCHQRNGELEFFVQDNGTGFDMRFADKLFGVFQRLHHADEFEGTGVGLANVRRIINRHGGRTWAEGKVNEGATFYFTLPLLAEHGRS